MEPRTKYTALIVVLVATASILAAVAYANIPDDKSNVAMEVAVAAFAIAGLIAIMPWQLAQSLAAAAPLTKEEHWPLITSGCYMSVAAMLFISSAVIHYFHCRLGGFVEDVGWYAILWLASSLASTLAFGLASFCFTVGVALFSWILCGKMFTALANDAVREPRDGDKVCAHDNQ